MKQPAMKRKFRHLVSAAALIAAASTTVVLIGCVERSGGTWRFREVKTVEGWPALTKPGTVEIKRYPEYRAASVDESSGIETSTGPMFNELFAHIKHNDIAMTAPVEMTYEERDDGDLGMASMAFLYGSPELGPEGRDGAVRVHDVEARTYAVTSVRGGYNEKNYERGLDTLADWISTQSVWAQSGPPRYMGYNSPFVPAFMQYAEIVIPVRRVDTD